MVKYLDLELHFGTQKPASESVVSATAGKEAYVSGEGVVEAARLGIRWGRSRLLPSLGWGLHTWWICFALWGSSCLFAAPHAAPQSLCLVAWGPQLLLGCSLHSVGAFLAHDHFLLPHRSPDPGQRW